VADLSNQIYGGRQVAGTDSIRVYVAESHGLSRYGIVRALTDSNGFEVIGEADDGRRAAHDLTRLSPDVAIVAERLPSVSGLELLRLVREDCPTRIVLLSGDLDTPAVYAALAAGAAGYLSSDTTGERLREVVASAARDEPMLAPDIQRLLLAEIQRGSNGHAPVLTTREREVLALLADGQGASQIAADLHVGISTAKKHLAHLYDKLEAPNSAAAVARAMRMGLID
jgi:two-component system, NarL family, nitrate/nitrite response regulator NarL